MNLSSELAKKKRRRRKKKKQEPNYKELMGVYRDTYKRGPGGAIKRRSF
ncbi:hypothetical protein RYX56_05760 [Alkalihalophilus lindianensis]|uniref:Uncharacterized protein n=1 Tax=Alkalihalophilus lindianensis TaxID=1630542 RepID=A0ABU3X7G5_9BACI|nr:hypothetical protein [Alkalihalophilus lindianensis]MDV2683814.1 hypothetical protein [Alkalihalophilus lindianensis]MDV2683880.1 hypothetical protein [Alkalihalophilus lindianensis]